MIVDVHAHFIPPTIVERVRNGAAPRRISLPPNEGGKGDIWTHGAMSFPLSDALINVQAMVTRMDEANVDHSILSVAPDLFAYERDHVETADIARVTNDDLVTMVADAPKRLSGLASLPLNDMGLALQELRRVQSFPGIVGVCMGTSVNERMLDDAYFDPLYAAMAKWRRPILLHPFLEGIDSAKFVSSGLDSYFLDNMIGNPFETTRAAGRLIFGGVFDRHPDLCIQLVHGGGHLIYQLGRMDHAVSVGLVPTLLMRRPSQYASNLLFDTILHSARAVDFLVDVVGADRVTFGTDLPFDMADIKPAASKAEQRPWSKAVLGDNAIRHYGLKQG